MRRIGRIICMVMFTMYCASSDGAVVQRTNTYTTTTTTTGGTVSAANRPTTAARTNFVSTAPVIVSSADSNQGDDTSEPENPEPIEEETEDQIIIENKTSQFDIVLNSYGASTGEDTSSSELEALIRQQRAALDTQDSLNLTTNYFQQGNNTCDLDLRKCMQNKCGDDFTGCSGDTDTSWGNKMDSCRRDTECTGKEFSAFAAEIKSDRDMNARLKSYNSIIDCGTRYNDCILAQCGSNFSKCLGKTAGDDAIRACKTIADNCKEQDSGLSGRVMTVFSELRQDAEIQVSKDEARLYELRDLISNQCEMLGAMFDERTFSCVYTIEFYAGDDLTLFASKKGYAGGTFNCTPDWFGIDITTFMENAYRATREQTSATSALLGAGLGTAVGAVTSGAIGRAIDTKKASNALKDAEKESESTSSDTTEKQENDKTQNSTSEEQISTGNPSNNNGQQISASLRQEGEINSIQFDIPDNILNTISTNTTNTANAKTSGDTGGGTNSLRAGGSGVDSGYSRTEIQSSILQKVEQTE